MTFRCPVMGLVYWTDLATDNQLPVMLEVVWLGVRIPYAWVEMVCWLALSQLSVVIICHSCNNNWVSQYSLWTACFTDTCIPFVFALCFGTLSLNVTEGEVTGLFMPWNLFFWWFPRRKKIFFSHVGGLNLDEDEDITGAKRRRIASTETVASSNKVTNNKSSVPMKITLSKPVVSQSGTQKVSRILDWV